MWSEILRQTGVEVLYGTPNTSITSLISSDCYWCNVNVKRCQIAAAAAAAAASVTASVSRQASRVSGDCIVSPTHAVCLSVTAAHPAAAAAAAGDDDDDDEDDTDADFHQSVVTAVLHKCNFYDNFTACDTLTICLLVCPITAPFQHLSLHPVTSSLPTWKTVPIGCNVLLASNLMPFQYLVKYLSMTISFDNWTTSKRENCRIKRNITHNIKVVCGARQWRGCPNSSCQSLSDDP